MPRSKHTRRYLKRTRPYLMKRATSYAHTPVVCLHPPLSTNEGAEKGAGGGFARCGAHAGAGGPVRGAITELTSKPNSYQTRADAEEHGYGSAERRVGCLLNGGCFVAHPRFAHLSKVAWHVVTVVTPSQSGGRGRAQCGRARDGAVGAVAGAPERCHPPRTRLAPSATMPQYRFTHAIVCFAPRLASTPGYLIRSCSSVR